MKNILLIAILSLSLGSCLSSKSIIKEDYKKSGLIELSAYYSPTNRMLTVNVSGDCTMPLTFSIIDFNGQTLSVKETTTLSTTVDMADYTSGLYLIRYRDVEGRNGTIKIRVN